MIIKILSSTGTFSAVRYNTNKMDRGDGELMRVGNMPHFDGRNELSPDEVKAYLKAHSSTNGRIKNAQFHAVISAKGKELDKHQLTSAAVKYLEKMGYGENPYIIVFHSDTENNHVHIVSSRVDNNGKKINDSNERRRSQTIRGQLMKELGVKTDKNLDSLLSYTCQNESQLTKLLEHNGYTVVKKNEGLEIKFNGEQKALLKVSDLKFTEPDQKRIGQLRAIFEKYARRHSTEPVPIFQKLKGDRDGDKVTGYRSDFGDFMKATFGVELAYHFSGNRPPFGYTIFDHNKRAIFKGSDVRKLNVPVSKEREKNATREARRLLGKVGKYNVSSVPEIKLLSRYFKVPEHLIPINDRKLDDSQRFHYQNLLDGFFDKRHWPDIERIGLLPIVQDGELYLMDRQNSNLLRAGDFLSEDIMNEFAHSDRETEKPMDIDLGPDMADDTDDSKLHRKKRKQRT